MSPKARESFLFELNAQASVFCHPTIIRNLSTRSVFPTTLRCVGSRFEWLPRSFLPPPPPSSRISPRLISSYLNCLLRVASLFTVHSMQLQLYAFIPGRQPLTLQTVFSLFFLLTSKGARPPDAVPHPQRAGGAARAGRAHVQLPQQRGGAARRPGHAAGDHVRELLPRRFKRLVSMHRLY